MFSSECDYVIDLLDGQQQEPSIHQWKVNGCDGQHEVKCLLESISITLDENSWNSSICCASLKLHSE
jgi:hypothetical protein